MKDDRRDKHQAGRSAILTQCWLRASEYTTAATPKPTPGWPVWTMWQYTQCTPALAIPGLGPCDRSRFNGPVASLHRLWTGAPVPA